MIMLSRLPLAIAVAGLMSTAVISNSFAADDPQEQNKAHHFRPSPEDRAAFLNARIAALHAGLELTPEQEKLWSPVETALRDLAKLGAAEREKFHDEKRPLDPIARLQQHSEALIARGQALKKLADAQAPLYAALSDAQKQRLPVLAHTIFHPFGHRHFAAAEGWRHGWAGEHGPRGDRPDQGPGADEHDHD
jgi:hypothetical protein